MSTKISPVPVSVKPQAQQQPQSQPKLARAGTIKTINDLGNFNDDSMVDLEFEKNQNKIDHTKMVAKMSEVHSRQPNGSKYNCDDVCCDFETGSHYLFSSSEKTDLTKFGVGIVLYFKFVKHLIFFFFIFLLLSVPAFVLYGASYSANTNSSSLSYLDLLTATTVGTVGLGATSCGLGKYPDYASSSDETKIFFQCSSGTLVGQSSLVYGFVKGGSTCNFVDTSEVAVSCNSYDSTLAAAFKSCEGQTSCSVTIQDTFFVDKTTSGVCKGMYQAKNVFMQLSCSIDTLTIFNNVEISKSTVAFIVAALDAAIVVVFLIMIYTLRYAQKSATQNVLKKAYSAASYTAQIKNLPQNMPAEELATKLWHFLNQKLGYKEGSGGSHRVVDVQIVLPNKLISVSKDLGEIIHEKNNLIREFMRDCAPDYPGSEINFKGVYNVLVSIKQKTPEKFAHAQKLFKKIKDLALKKEKLMLEIKKLKTTKASRIVAAFVTFNSIPARNRILDLFSSSANERCARIFCRCCYDKDISFYGKILRAQSASDPGSILWENLGEPGSSVFARRAFSTFLTILLWIVSGSILVVSTYQKNYFKQKYPTIDCSDKGAVTQAAAATDYLLGDLQTGLLECYCKVDLVNRLTESFPTVNNKELCTTWFKAKVLQNSVNIGIAFLVLIINYIIQFIFQTLSKFEKHSTLNKQLAQRVLKTFVAQFLTTGVLILLVNAQIKSVKLWQGKFVDLTPLWYENVGTTLLSTMIINVFTVPIIKVIFVLLQKLSRCCDRGCGCDEKYTSKKTQVAYENLYMGPEFIVDFRYSQILTLTFVCFLYSGTMPFLYLSTFVQLFITYFFDKFFLLRVSKLPKNYDENLENVVRTAMFPSIVIHLAFTIFAFGCPSVFNAESSSIGAFTSAANAVSSAVSSSSENYAVKFFKRCVIEHNLVLSILFFAITGLAIAKGLLWTFLRRTVIGFFMKDTDEARKKTIKVSSNDPRAKNAQKLHTFFQVVKSEDIATLIRLTKVTISETSSEDYKNLLKKKLVLLKEEYMIKKKEEENDQVEQNVNFIGFYTYDVRLAPMYKEQFAIEERLDDENLD